MNKKYILKPGKHQFTPSEAATHDNDNLTDQVAEWYLERYPHIRSLFLSTPEQAIKVSPRITKSKKIKLKPERKENAI